jgi:hypothetical protein
MATGLEINQPKIGQNPLSEAVRKAQRKTADLQLVDDASGADVCAAELRLPSILPYQLSPGFHADQLGGCKQSIPLPSVS